jgi:hypothetical protein
MHTWWANPIPIRSAGFEVHKALFLTRVALLEVAVYLLEVAVTSAALCLP